MLEGSSLLVGLGVFELVMWGLDPLGVHEALNDGVPMQLSERALAATFNAAPLLILAWCIARLQHSTSDCSSKKEGKQGEREGGKEGDTSQKEDNDEDDDNGVDDEAKSQLQQYQAQERRAPSSAWPVAVASVLMPFLFLFTGMQLFFWWLPYLFDICPGKIRGRERDREEEEGGERQRDRETDRECVVVRLWIVGSE